MKRCSFIFCVLLLSGQVCHAQTDSMVIHMRNGSKKIIALSQIKRITFDSVKANVEKDSHKDLVLSYPNPTTGKTHFTFFMETAGDVIISITDAKGVSIRKLSSFFAEGIQHISWDGLNQLGAPASSGLYTVDIALGAKKVSIKIILFRP